MLKKVSLTLSLNPLFYIVCTQALCLSAGAFAWKKTKDSSKRFTLPEPSRARNLKSLWVWHYPLSLGSLSVVGRVQSLGSEGSAFDSPRSIETRA